MPENLRQARQAGRRSASFALESETFSRPKVTRRDIPIIVSISVYL